MKAKIYLLLLTMQLIHIGGLAQLTGGGKIDRTPQQTNEKKGVTTRSNTWSSIHVGLANPVGAFKENTFHKPFDQAVGALPGIYLQFDLVTHLSSDQSPFRIGITESIGLSENGVNWSQWAFQGNRYSSSGFITCHFLIGPIVTYEPTPQVSFDAFLKMGINSGLSQDRARWKDREFVYHSFGSSRATSMANAAVNLGMNFRLRRLFITTAMNLGKLKYNYHASWSATSTTYKLPVSTLRLGIGVKMGRG